MSLYYSFVFVLWIIKYKSNVFVYSLAFIDCLKCLMLFNVLCSETNFITLYTSVKKTPFEKYRQEFRLKYSKLYQGHFEDTSRKRKVVVVCECIQTGSSISLMRLLIVFPPPPPYPCNSRVLAWTYPVIYRILCPRRPGTYLPRAYAGRYFLQKG